MQPWDPLELLPKGCGMPRTGAPLQADLSRGVPPCLLWRHALMDFHWAAAILAVASSLTVYWAKASLSLPGVMDLTGRHDTEAWEN
mmetsp:Transcript_1721/g.3814  ORF Transcript_1721/g.3814 Transcript_1721/m.3814 type:complete len:86 (+) Transcript_1721:981-1238(+)